MQLHPTIFCSLVLGGLVYLCRFEGSFECITLGTFIVNIHFGFKD